MHRNPATPSRDVFMVIVDFMSKRRPKPPPLVDLRSLSAAAAFDVRLSHLLDLLPQQRHRIVRMLQIGNQIVGGAADEALDVRELHDRLVELDHHRPISASTQPLSWPEYLPGDV